MKSILAILIIGLSLISCQKITEDGETFQVHDVMVGIKNEFSLANGFKFINTFDFRVEEISSVIFYCDLPADSIFYLQDYLYERKYLRDGNRKEVIHTHYQTNRMYFMVTMKNMHKKEHQEDWLRCMQHLKLTSKTNEETSAYVIIFHVPRNTESYWVEKFLEYEFVKWAELNKYSDFTLY